MGFFSWKTSDTGETVANKFTDQGATPCKMLDNQGNEWLETDYEGYGEFGGMDYYALVDTMSGGAGRRDAGIRAAFADSTELLPKIVSIDCKTSWQDLPDSPICETQGFWL